MSRKKVLAMFAGARTYPRTIALPASHHIHGSVTLDDADRLDSITLTSTYPRPPELTDAALLDAANRVAAALDLEPLAALPTERKTWTRRATRIVFELDGDCFSFRLSPV